MAHQENAVTIEQLQHLAPLQQAVRRGHAQRLAVIRQQDHDGIGEHAFAFQAVEDAAELAVGRDHAIQVPIGRIGVAAE